MIGKKYFWKKKELNKYESNEWRLNWKRYTVRCHVYAFWCVVFDAALCHTDPMISAQFHSLVSIPNMTKNYNFELQFQMDIASPMQMRIKRYGREQKDCVHAACTLCIMLCAPFYNWTCLSIHVFDFNGKLQNKWMITDETQATRCKCWMCFVWPLLMLV